MELIDRYTREVGRNLPENMRVDIEKEIRSLIEDNLEDESQKAGRAPDEAMVVDVLKSMGPPDRVAASYLPPRYLIGPELYPHFITTLRIVITVVVILAVVGIALSLAFERTVPQNAFELAIGVLGQMLSALINAAGIVVLVFAIIQNVIPGFKPEEKAWDPRQMRSEPDPERISIPEIIFEVVMTFIILIVFNLYPEWIGISSIVNGEWVHVPVLSEAFFRLLPWLSIVWVLEIASNLWLVAQGQWSKLQRWVSIILSLFSIGILAVMLTGPSITGLQPDAFSLLGWNLPAEAAQRVIEALEGGARLTLGLIIALQFIEVGKHLYKLFRLRLPEAVISNK